jgi:hypothetical protein
MDEFTEPGDLDLDVFAAAQRMPAADREALALHVYLSHNGTAVSQLVKRMGMTPPRRDKCRRFALAQARAAQIPADLEELEARQKHRHRRIRSEGCCHGRRVGGSAAGCAAHLGWGRC